MTGEERCAAEWRCTRLIHLYANLIDAARWSEVAALYAEDGWMTRPTAPDARVVGRFAILAAFRSRPAKMTRHVCANVVIEVLDEKTAKGSSAMLLFNRGRQAAPDRRLRRQVCPRQRRLALRPTDWKPNFLS